MWLRNRVKKLEEQHDILARGLVAAEDRLRALKAEWLDWESKLVKLYARNATAARRLEAVEQAAAATAENPNGNLGLDGGAVDRAAKKARLRQLAQALRGTR